MKLTNLRLVFILLFALCPHYWLPTTAVAQSPQLNWKKGDVVEAEWNGKWYKAEIIEAKDDLYKIHYDGYGDNFDEIVKPSRLRAVETSAKNNQPKKNNQPEKKEKPIKEWTWKDASGNVRTAAEFHNILFQHSQWLASSGQRGARADLTGADLTSLELPVADLKGAQMPGVNLTKANLTAVFLNDANLSGALFYETTIFGLMENVNLSGAAFNRAKVSGTLSGADLSEVKIFNSDFAGAVLARTDFSRAVIFDSNFAGVLLGSANLTNAKVFGGDWTDVNLMAADVRELHFEPTKNPDTRAVAGASNLEFITYGTSPDAVTMLRNSLRENGFHDAQLKITYALKHRQNQIRKEQAKDNWFKYVYYYLNLIFFDWTVRYGLQPERALIIVLYLWFIFAVVYDLFIHFPGRSGIFLVKNRVRKNVQLTSAIRVRPRVILPTSRGKYFWRWLKSEWRVFRISLFFSATRALHLGYGELDLGRWLQMLTKREYELKPKHWTRSLSGLQSLLSLYLIVMWILTEFSNPFD